MPLTPTQGTILAAIHTLTDEHKYAPTLREIADRVGMASVSAVSRQINRLVELGHVERQPGTPRSIRLAQSITHTAAPPSPEDPVGAVREADQRTRQAERALSAAQAEIGHSRRRGARWKAEAKAVRALHRAVPEHPRALLEAHTPDRECIECGRNVDLDTNRHHWDLDSSSWRCTARGARSPMVCGHCRDHHGRPVPAPCPTIEAMNHA
jgi:DNA-binding Lrp family transcriptional regulator